MTNITKKLSFIESFINAQNAADGSKVDANANITQKDIAVLEAELYKEDTITINRHLVYKKLRELYGHTIASLYLQDIRNHLIYVHDETSLKPYCASVTLYPFLIEGTKSIGGTSKAPKNLRSFCGSFVNLMYQLASNFAGAVATVEFLMYFDYFARKTYGDNYRFDHEKEIIQELQGVVYSLNQPAAARGNQSVFWNISIFDKYYFEALFGEFIFPDGTKPDYSSVNNLQQLFLVWLAEERQKELLTFPVLTAAYLTDSETKKPKDLYFTRVLAARMSEGLSFFHYQSTSADSLASCCRLRNELADNDFSYTLGAGGVSTGSFQVITINFNRLTQRDGCIEFLLLRIQSYLHAHRCIIQDYINAGMLPAYSAGYISLDKQFGTIGINGMLEAWETLPDKTLYHDNYPEFLKENLSIIKAANKRALQKYGFRFNTEFVPAENLGIKNAKWDKEDGLVVPRDCYNSYFYPVESDMTILERLELHGEEISQYLDGGAACHLNLEQIPKPEQARTLIDIACRLGVPYWTTNVLCTICNDCGYINPATKQQCTTCNSTNIDYGTRIIGYLKPISKFAKGRRDEANRRHYMKINNKREENNND